MPGGNDAQPNAESPQGGRITNDAYRALIRNRLRHLVSPGTAEFYDDACKQMDAVPPLPTTTHTVGHLLREIESSLRDVLMPLTSITQEVCNTCHKPTSDDKCAECGTPKLISQSTQIDAILTVLEIDTKGPLGDAWRTVAGSGHKYAHRDGLKSPRPVDAEFIEHWNRMETILVGVLDRFEAQYAKVMDGLDKLLAKNAPTRADVATFLSNFANNQLTRDYFFERLVHASWLAPLRAKDVFKRAPDPQYFEDGSYRHPSWPAASYLKRMASTNPADVAAILNEVEDTDNDVAKGQLVEIASELPAEHREVILGKLTQWI